MTSLASSGTVLVRTLNGGERRNWDTGGSVALAALVAHVTCDILSGLIGCSGRQVCTLSFWLTLMLKMLSMVESCPPEEKQPNDFLLSW